MSEWYCNVVVLERRPFFLLTHARTLFVFLMPVAGNTHHPAFSRSVREYARATLLEEGIADAAARRVLGDKPDVFASTADRGVLGSMVDYAHMAKARVAHEGGLAPGSVAELCSALNDVPMGRIGMDRPNRMMRRLLDRQRGA